jgi:hypothetical protein
MLVDSVAYQACLESRHPGKPEEELIGKCVEELSSAIQEALTASEPKRRPRADPRPSLPASIHDEIRLKRAEEAVVSHKGSRSESPGQPPPEVGHPLAERAKKRTTERCAGILRQCGPVAVQADKDDEIPNCFASLACAGKTSVIRLRGGRVPGRQP